VQAYEYFLNIHTTKSSS